MTKAYFKVYLIPFYLMLSACGSKVDIRPTVIQDAEAYTNEGLHAFAEDDRLKAQLLFSKALILYQGVDDQSGVIHTHINLAEVNLSLDEYSASLKHLDEASHNVKPTLAPDVESRITLLYSLNALKQNKIEQAEITLQTLLPEFDQQVPVVSPNDIQLAAIACRTRIAFVQKKDEQLWTQRYARSLKKSAIKNHSFNARLLRFEALLLQGQGDYQGAESKLQRALLLYKNIPARPGIAVTLAELGQLAVMAARWQLARDYYSRSIAVYRHLNDFDKVSELTERLAKVDSIMIDLNAGGVRYK